jgi:uncharacterized protein (TIGR03435 family)
MFSRTGLVVLGCVGAFAQAPSFEVASIKPAAPITPGQIRVGIQRDQGRITYSGVTLKILVQNAYRVKPYQISGPNWLDSDRFEIVAKLPEGAKQDQIPEMLQNLLAERFGLKLHRETKELPVYALVTGKNGPKLEEVEAPAGPPPGGGGPGGPGGPGPGAMMRMEPGKMTAQRIKMDGFVGMLSNLVGRPVIDETKLTGFYNITLEFSPEEFANMKGGMRIVGPGGGEAGGAAKADAGPAPDSAPGASLFQSVQKLGLKLEPRKGPVEFLVIDHVEKTPTEN